MSSTHNRPNWLVLLALLALSSVSACVSHEARPIDVPSASLVAPDGHALLVRDEVARAPLTVIFFFSDHCPCQAAHDVRLRELYQRYASRGVAFLGVASEVSVTADDIAKEARARGYPFPLLRDPKARFADALGAGYATFTVIVDQEGHVRYRGGLDSDRSHLKDDALPYVAWALDDLLAGRPLRKDHAEVLGCALQKS